MLRLPHIHFEKQTNATHAQNGRFKMYTTIEADVENGVIVGKEAKKLPNHAHVLITLLLNKKETRTTQTKVRFPHKDILGKTDTTGDIINTVPLQSWNLPS
jgi:hypothetical protein